MSAVIPSDPAEVEGVCRAAAELLEGGGLGDRVYAVDLLLREFVNNAIRHGNRSDPSRRVRIAVRIGRRAILLRIADEGPGFDWRAASRSVPDPSETSGRGLAIGMHYADRMRFNNAGNQVVLAVGKKREDQQEVYTG